MFGALFFYLVGAAAALTVQQELVSSRQHDNRLTKRNARLQCEPVPLYDITESRTIRAFGTLEHFCKTSPQGLGLTCHGNTPIMLDYARREIFWGATPNQIRNYYFMCAPYCHCVDDGDDDNVSTAASVSGTAAVSLAASTSIDTLTATDGTATTAAVTSTPTGQGECRRGWRNIFHLEDSSWFKPEEAGSCSATWYGHPTVEDCRAALSKMPQGNGRFEFLGPGVPSMGNGRDRNGCPVESPPLQGPIIRRHGTCTAALTHRQADEYLAMEMFEVRDTWTGLFTKCVAGQGIGGILIPPPWWKDWLVGEVPVITLSGPRSKFNKALNDRYMCQVKSDGSAICPSIVDALGLPPIRKVTPNGGTHRSDRSKKRKCSGTCYNPDECDINSDCICASKKDMLLSSTSWGQHSCMHIAGAAIALSSTLMKSRGLCNGRRCLLEDDGALVIPADQPDANSASSDNTTNQTAPLSPSSPSPSSSGPPSSNPAVISGVAYADPTTTTTNNPNSNTPSPSPPLNASAFGPLNENFTMPTQPPLPPVLQLPSELICPCNCTYVSAACCLSSTVWEDPSLQIHLDSKAANNASLCCDLATGKWEGTWTSGCRAGGGDGGAGNRSSGGGGAGMGFESLGSVPVPVGEGPGH